MTTASFRFYAELNNFLVPSQRQRLCSHPCSRDASVKHMIEALGVPHTEVELILVDGVSVDFSYRVDDGELISVYPCFNEIDISPLVRLRPRQSGINRFIADAHLGQLARNLRMLGFDVLYRNDYSDAEVARIAADDGRIVLTRDRDLLIRKEIVYGCYLHAINGDEQLSEVLVRFDLARSAQAFSRCLNCNGILQTVAKRDVEHRVPLHSRLVYDRFYECQGCAHVYWEGSHVVRMRQRVAEMLGSAGVADR
ncbi:Mut7-C RNAse domain-containing protein [Noviherbaspirillum saxi]|uniref:Twitching motility protein PilT n=1 Tax=Noviherbaspirillum saxi TaxID=2320863 RepID=A0A3A3FT47_9BURK|nr:Mut7-C RNAse domain-containing protein [Noviherbaspirillum saxi]RJF99226.1 twitching motility protein PilT [Noviherbaspirillum saxi]